MTEITVVNSKIENIGKLNTSVSLASDVINVPVVHQVVKALLAQRRQGNASTKTKAFVRGGGRKPYAQKGTGRARQGSTRSPLLVGGGTAFGPQPRSYDQKINKKVMLKALHSLIADKFQARKLIVVDQIQVTGKTKEMAKLLSDRKITPALVVANNPDSLAIRAVSNLPTCKGLSVDGFSVYEAVKYEHLIIEKEALEKLLGKLV